MKSRLPNRAQPVPPIYQPEVGADAVYWASENRRRELWVGLPTVGAILGSRLAPGLLDRYLATTGYAAQQTAEPEDSSRPDNLWSAVPGDFGAHGAFDGRASGWSPQLWASTHRRTTLAAVLAAGAAIAFTALKLRTDGDRGGAAAYAEGEEGGETVHRPIAGLNAREREELRMLIERPV